jgi:hypothetical protein
MPQSVVFENRECVASIVRQSINAGIFTGNPAARLIPGCVSVVNLCLVTLTCRSDQLGMSLTSDAATAQIGNAAFLCNGGPLWRKCLIRLKIPSADPIDSSEDFALLACERSQ